MGNISLFFKKMFGNSKSNGLLKDSELKRHAIFDETFEFIGLMTPDGILIETNKTALEFSGIQASDVINKPFWETPWWSHSKELRAELKDGIKKAAQGEFVRFEATHYDKGYDLRHIDFSIKPVKDNSGKVIYLIPEGRDITEYKKMEEALRLDNEVIRHIDQGVIYILGNINIIIFANSQFTDMFGYRSGELYGKNAITLFPPISDVPREETYARIVDALNMHRTWKGELQNIRKDGTVFHTKALITAVKFPPHGKAWVGIFTEKE